MALPIIGGIALGTLMTSIGKMLMDWAFKLLGALGVSFVSYQFTSSAFERLLGYIEATYFRIDGVVLDVLGLAGVPEAFNIIFGAFNFCIGLLTTGKALKFFHGAKK